MNTQKTQQEHNHIPIDKAMYEIERNAIRNNAFFNFDFDGCDTDPIYALDETINDFLNAKEREVIKRRFYLQETLRSIGKSMGINPERVRQIEATALRRMRHPSRIVPLWELARAFGIVSEKTNEQPNHRPPSFDNPQLPDIDASLPSWARAMLEESYA